MTLVVKEDLIGLYARYRWLKTGLAVLLALLFIQVGRSEPFWAMSSFRDVCFDVIFAVVISYFAFSLIEYIHVQLDVHCNWCVTIARRAILQIVLGVLLPLAVVMLFYFGYGKLYYQEHFSLSKNYFFEFEMPIVFLMLMLVNVYYTFIYFLHHLKVVSAPINTEMLSVDTNTVDKPDHTASNEANTKVLLVNKGQKQHIVEVDEVAFIVIKGELVSVFLFDGTSYWMNESLESIEKKLPPYFFRANRQCIIQFKAVKSFIAEKSGRLIVDIIPNADAHVMVSQRKAQEFKSWLLAQQ